MFSDLQIGAQWVGLRDEGESRPERGLQGEKSSLGSGSPRKPRRPVAEVAAEKRSKRQRSERRIKERAEKDRLDNLLTTAVVELSAVTRSSVGEVLVERVERFCPGMFESVTASMGVAVHDSTRAQYHPTVRSWVRVCEDLGVDIFMRGLDEAAQKLVMGCFYTQQSKEGKTVGYSTAPIRKLFVDNDLGRVARLLDDPRVHNVKVNLMLNGVRSSRATRKVDRRLVPVELLWSVIVMYGFRKVEDRSEDKRVYDQMIVLYLMILYGYGVRPGNLLHDSKSKGKHAIRTPAVLARLSTGHSNRPPLAFPIDELHALSTSPRCRMEFLTSVTMTFTTGKNVGSVKTLHKKPLVLEVTRAVGTSFQASLLDLLYAHGMDAGLKSGDILMSVNRNGANKKLRIEDAMTAVHRGAESLGIAPEGVNSTTFRRTCASSLQGLGGDYAKLLGNWSKATPLTYIVNSGPMLSGGDVPSFSFDNTFKTVDVTVQHEFQRSKGSIAENYFDLFQGPIVGTPEPLIAFMQRSGPSEARSAGRREGSPASAKFELGKRRRSEPGVLEVERSARALSDQTSKYSKKRSRGSTEDITIDLKPTDHGAPVGEIITRVDRDRAREQKDSSRETTHRTPDDLLRGASLEASMVEGYVMTDATGLKVVRTSKEVPATLPGWTYRGTREIPGGPVSYEYTCDLEDAIPEGWTVDRKRGTYEPTATLAFLKMTLGDSRLEEAVPFGWRRINKFLGGTALPPGWCYDVVSNDLKRWVYGDGEPMHYAPYEVDPDCTAIDLSGLESGEVIRAMAQRREDWGSPRFEEGGEEKKEPKHHGGSGEDFWHFGHGLTAQSRNELMASEDERVTPTYSDSLAQYPAARADGGEGGETAFYSGNPDQKLNWKKIPLGRAENREFVGYHELGWLADVKPTRKSVSGGYDVLMDNSNYDQAGNFMDPVTLSYGPPTEESQTKSADQSLSLRCFRECPDLVKTLNRSKFVGAAEYLEGSRCTREERLAGAIVKCKTPVEFIDQLLARGQHTFAIDKHQQLCTLPDYHRVWNESKAYGYVSISAEVGPSHQAGFPFPRHRFRASDIDPTNTHMVFQLDLMRRQWLQTPAEDRGTFCSWMRRAIPPEGIDWQKRKLIADVVMRSMRQRNMEGKRATPFPGDHLELREDGSIWDNSKPQAECICPDDCGGRGKDEWWSYAVSYERPKPSLLPVEEALDLIGVSDQRTAVPNPAKNRGRAMVVTRRDDSKADTLKELSRKTPLWSRGTSVSESQHSAHDKVEQEEASDEKSSQPEEEYLEYQGSAGPSSVGSSDVSVRSEEVRNEGPVPGRTRSRHSVKEQKQTALSHREYADWKRRNASHTAQGAPTISEIEYLEAGFDKDLKEEEEGANQEDQPPELLSIGEEADSSDGGWEGEGEVLQILRGTGAFRQESTEQLQLTAFEFHKRGSGRPPYAQQTDEDVVDSPIRGKPFYASCADAYGQNAFVTNDYSRAMVPQRSEYIEYEPYQLGCLAPQGVRAFTYKRDAFAYAREGVDKRWPPPNECVADMGDRPYFVVAGGTHCKKGVAVFPFITLDLCVWKAVTMQPDAIVAIRHSFKEALEFLAESRVNLPEHYVIRAEVHEEEGGDQDAQGVEPSTIATEWRRHPGKTLGRPVQSGHLEDLEATASTTPVEDEDESEGQGNSEGEEDSDGSESSSSAQGSESDESEDNVDGGADVEE